MRERNDLALKEWATVVKAMLAGQQILLLRKGGIEEDAFCLVDREFWLFPTYEHQSLHRIRPEFHHLLVASEQERQVGKIRLEAYGMVAAVLHVGSLEVLRALSDEHIWTDEFLTQRWQYKPHLPLYGLAVRVYRLPTPFLLEEHPDYAGCRSWVPLKTALPAKGLSPVLSDAAFAAKLERLLQAGLEPISVKTARNGSETAC